MLLAAFLLAFGAYLAIGAYRIKYRGRVDLIAGVKHPSLLATPKALAIWVGNLSFVGAGVMVVGGAAWLVMPKSYVLLTVLTADIALTLAATKGIQSRRQTKSNA